MATAAGIQPIADPIGSHAFDPREDEIRQRNWGLTARVDPTVTWEEYIYWAKIEREEENAINRTYKEERGPRSVGTVLKGRFSKGIHYDNAKKLEQEMQIQGGVTGDDKTGVVTSSEPNSVRVSDEEWKTAARALRTASWGTIFFLITTDILGWSTTPYVSPHSPICRCMSGLNVLSIQIRFRQCRIWCRHRPLHHLWSFCRSQRLDAVENFRHP